MHLRYKQQQIVVNYSVLPLNRWRMSNIRPLVFKNCVCGKKTGKWCVSFSNSARCLVYRIHHQTLMPLFATWSLCCPKVLFKRPALFDCYRRYTGARITTYRKFDYERTFNRTRMRRAAFALNLMRFSTCFIPLPSCSRCAFGEAILTALNINWNHKTDSISCNHEH